MEVQEPDKRTMMAKRFTDTEKWRDPWFSELPHTLKLFWIYLLDNCDHAGIWKINKRLAEFEMGVQPPWGERPGSVPKELADRVEANGEYWFIPKFLRWQYGEKLNKGDAFSSAFERIEAKGFLESLKRVMGGSIDSLGRVKAKATAKAKAKAEEGGVGEETEKLPNPKKPLTDLQRVVMAFKTVTGYPAQDAAWDKLNFSRCSKSAKSLLDFFGSWEKAADCIRDVYGNLNSKGLTVTLETVVKHAADWKKGASHGKQRSEIDRLLARETR